MKTVHDIELQQKELAGFSFDYGPLLDQLLAPIQTDDIVVELGTFIGCSTVYIASNFKRRNLRPFFYTIDTFRPYAKATQSYAMMLLNLRDCGVLGHVVPIVSDSAGASFLFTDQSVKLCWVDAGHTYADVSRDLAAWFPKVKHGGVLAGHDYSEPGVQKAVEELCARHQLTCTVFKPEGWKSWYVQIGSPGV